jgi:predicted ribosomally synthesized peptide with SipW-like signal peptide
MTDGDDIFELSRRKALAGLGTIGAASAGAGLGTSAFFSDTETFEGNSLTAGTLDMVVAYEEHYSDWSDDEDDGVTGDVQMEDPTSPLSGSRIGLPSNAAPMISVENDAAALQFLANTQEDVHPDGFDRQDLPADADPCGDESGSFDDGSTTLPPAIELSDVKPGDFGEVTFSFGLCDNPGYVWATAANVSATENGVNEPEASDEDEDQRQGDGDPQLKQAIIDGTVSDPNAPGPTVELLDEVRAAVWVDDGNNYQNGDESPALVGTLRQVLADLIGGNGFPLVGDIDASEGGGTGRNCFSANTVHDVVFAWWLPVDHANEIQTDSVTFDLGFYTEQCRHNPGDIITLDAESPQGQGDGFANPWDISTTMAHRGDGSWGTIDRSGQGISSYKQGFYFGGEFDNIDVLPAYTIGDISEISYWLKEPTALEGVDIYLNIYTQPEGDSGDSGGFYDSRLQALPSRANQGSPNFTPGEWNKFSTSAGASNTLNWSDTGRGGNFNLNLPTLDDLQAGPVDWSTYGGNISFTHDYSDETVRALSLQTGSVSGISLEAWIDDITVKLTSGETLRLDLEP